MRVLAEIRWCEKHEDFVPSKMEVCRSWLYLVRGASTECVVVDAQVTRKADEPVLVDKFGILTGREDG